MGLRITLWLWFQVALVVAKPIDLQEALTIGGISQWISTKGSDTSHPLLLYLHGGPGNSSMSYSQKFTGDLQKYFVVIQWDQRASGRTAQLNPTETATSLSQMSNDAVELIRLLLQKHSREKLFLVGHSWGGFLALEVAASNPELLAACLTISPMVNQNESERRTLRWMKEHADARDPAAKPELDLIQVPFVEVRDLYFHRKWLSKIQGSKPVSKEFVDRWAKLNFRLFQEASRIDLFAIVPEIRCPVYFFLGGKDRQTDCHLTEEYFKVVKAEKKDLFWFPDSGHNLNLTEPKRLQQVIISLLSHKT